MTDNEQTISRMYERFNARDMDGVIAVLAENVSWANGMERTHIHGTDAVREYWTYQWGVINPHVTPVKIHEATAGTVSVAVHQVVHDLGGALLLDETIEHVFQLENGVVTRFDIQGDSQLSAVPH